MITLLFSLSMASINMRGQIIDKDSNEPLIGANVVVLHGDKQKGSATDELGNYLISNISLGKYDLVVSYIGYDTYKKEIVINQETPKEYKLDIALTVSEYASIKPEQMLEMAEMECLLAQWEALGSHLSSMQDTPFLVELSVQEIEKRLKL